MVYSSVLSHELCYAVSSKPDREYTYGGTLVSIGDIGYQGRTAAQADNYTGNTHGGMVQVNGQWYIFYHRQTNKQKCCRQGCAEKITILPDGSIPQVEVTSCGLNDGPLEGKGTYEARIACNLQSAQGTFAYLKTREKDKKNLHPYFTQSGGDREDHPDQYIANMKVGASAGFKYFRFDGLKRVSITIRASESGRMEVRTAPEADPIAVIGCMPSADWKTYSASVTTDVSGTQALYFTWKGSGAVDFSEFTL